MDKKTVENELKERLHQIWDQHEAPGALVGITFSGERAIAASGVTSIDNPLPITAQTFFQIGSITKTFTALALLRLMARDPAALDTPLLSYLPELRLADEAATRQVTARHLVTHLAGWEGDLFINTGKGPEALAAYMARMVELKQHASPGSLFAYNNAAFSLAGYLIERLSSLAYEAAVGKFVLEPLDLHHTCFEAEDIITQRFAVGHIITDERREVARPWTLPRCIFPAGGIVTTIGDLLTYAEALLGLTATNETDLSPEMLNAMWEPQHWIAAARKAIGLSWFIDDWGGTRVVSHQGATNGQTAGLFLVPEHNFAVAVLTNSSRGSSFIGPITRWALQELLSLEPTTPAPLELAEDVLQEYTGLYTRPFADVRVSISGRQLETEVHYKQGFPSREDPPPPDPTPTAYAAYEPDRFFADGALGSSGELDFFRDAGGQLSMLRVLNRVHTRVE